MGAEATHTDITTMYPSVKLDPEYWCLQKYLWSEDLATFIVTGAYDRKPGHQLESHCLRPQGENSVITACEAMKAAKTW